MLGMNNSMANIEVFFGREKQRNRGLKQGIIQYVCREVLLSLETKAQRTSQLIEISIESLTWVFCSNF